MAVQSQTIIINNYQGRLTIIMIVIIMFIYCALSARAWGEHSIYSIFSKTHVHSVIDGITRGLSNVPKSLN